MNKIESELCRRSVQQLTFKRQKYKIRKMSIYFVLYFYNNEVYRKLWFKLKLACVCSINSMNQ